MKNISLKYKLYILVLTAIIPMLVLHCVIIKTQYEHAIEAEMQSSEDYAQAVDVAFMNYLEKIWHAEYAIGLSIYNNPDASIEKMQDYLKNLVDDVPTVMAVTWCSPMGTVLFASNGGAPGLDIYEREYFKEILRGKDKVVSDLLIGKVSKGPTLIVARAIREGQDLKGVVTMSVDVDKIEMVLPTNRLKETSSFGLIDRQGMIVYKSNSTQISYEDRKIKEDSPGWAALNGEIARTGNYMSSENISYMIVDVPVKSIGWAAFASVASDEVLSRLINDSISSFIIMLIIVFVSFSLALYIVINILKPVRILEKSAIAISSRDFTARTNLNRKDELGHTGMVFDQMAQHIQELESGRQLFLQTAAHELRNPMTSIKGIASLIRMRINKGKSINDSLELIETLENEVSRLSGLLNKILEAFKIQSKNIEIKANLIPIDIREVIQTTVKPFALDTSNNRSIVIENHGPAQVLGDFERLADVIRNFIDNAIKYSEEMTTIHIKIYTQDDYVIVAVKDEGIGIPKDQLNKIFDSFYRVKNRESKDPGGMGLGLYICKDIIVRHGGDIWAENNADKGSTFYIKLPLYKTVQAAI
ncbi:sensor histidine kinase YycG [Oxobacter pfennigii]|uniref:histidine kinase n=1 Tax=Oxobacter pfennigii TaxID=36849 RepID=A0A0P9AIK3_9CLOT|nr:ATP-binding protein [Oxobacter pfennigii]KPU45299.1 sensor histidine kinase YycG [Oxobacter pfennigii]